MRGYGERVLRRRAAQPFEDLISQLRNPPWWSPQSNPLADPYANTGEFFIHHEDVRRGAPGWQPAR